MILILLADMHWKAYEDISGETNLAKDMNVESNESNETEWPHVQPYDWCGEFMAKTEVDGDFPGAVELGPISMSEATVTGIRDIDDNRRNALINADRIIAG